MYQADETIIVNIVIFIRIFLRLILSPQMIKLMCHGGFFSPSIVARS